MKLVRIAALAAAVGFLAACSDAPLSPTLDAPNAMASATSVKVPFSQVAFVPCAAGGAGELVLVSGTLNIVSATNLDANGGVHSKIHFQPQGATGVGLTTGDVYRATGVTQETLNISGAGLPFTDTYVNNFRVVGPGPDNNLLVHETVHFTINANGVLTAFVNNVSVTCQ